MALQITRHFSRPLLALAAAAFLIQTGAATAADSTRDIQQQMNAVLAGDIPAESRPRQAAAATPTASAQELVSQVLLGTTGSRLRDTSQAESRNRPVAHGNAQVAIVQQFLLGQRHGSDAS